MRKIMDEDGSGYIERAELKIFLYYLYFVKI